MSYSVASLDINYVWDPEDNAAASTYQRPVLQSSFNIDSTQDSLQLSGFTKPDNPHLTQQPHRRGFKTLLVNPLFQVKPGEHYRPRANYNIEHIQT